MAAHCTAPRSTTNLPAGQPGQLVAPEEGWNVPTPHARQLELPGSGWERPGGQLTQAPTVSAGEEKEPGEQAKQSEARSAPGSPVLLPAEQAVHFELPNRLLNVPVGQGEQPAMGGAANLPAAQSVQLAADEAPAESEDLPAGQTSHDAWPLRDWNCPAGQSKQLGAPLLREAEPAGHGEQRTEPADGA
jgi:hypothetical protein